MPACAAIRSRSSASVRSGMRRPRTSGATRGDGSTAVRLHRDSGPAPQPWRTQARSARRRTPSSGSLVSHRRNGAADRVACRAWRSRRSPRREPRDLRRAARATARSRRADGASRPAPPRWPREWPTRHGAQPRGHFRHQRTRAAARGRRSPRGGWVPSAASSRRACTAARCVERLVGRLRRSGAARRSTPPPATGSSATRAAHDKHFNRVDGSAAPRTRGWPPAAAPAAATVRRASAARGRR